MAKPSEERGYCLACGSKALGNTYVASHKVAAPYAYRQCSQCSHIHVIGPATPTAPKPDFPRNKVERNVFELFTSGKGGGKLLSHYLAGQNDAPPPARNDSAAYAAWMAGNAAR